jgi:thiamine biosynthesis lipoprotein
MNRRDFLHPHQVATAAGHVAGAVAELRTAAIEAAEPDPVPGPEFSVLHFSRRAMATMFEMVVPFGTPAALEAAQAALDEIDRLERQLTVYTDTSEVSRLNRAAAHAAIPVEPGLFDLLQTSARISAATGGAFDVTAGALVKAWGFFRGPRRVPSEEERARATARTGMTNVVLNAQDRSVRFLRPGLEINLGSIGKGYALDRAAALLREEWNLPSGLLHGGHSSVYAIGTEPGDERGWAVGITHPWDLSRRLAVVRLRDFALGTSSATFRHLEYNGKKLGHILDPRTGWPAEGIALASVLAPTAAEADALATAFYILGINGARAYCDDHPEIGALLLPEGADTPLLLGLARKTVQFQAG